MVDTGPYMELLGKSVTTTADATYTQEELPTPIGRSENIAMLIHKIRIEYVVNTLDTPALGDLLLAQVLARTKNAIITYGDPDLMHKLAFVFNILTSGGGWNQMVAEANFNPPILFSRSQLYLGCQTNGQSGTRQFDFQIGYTLQKVSSKDFIAALTD